MLTSQDRDNDSLVDRAELNGVLYNSLKAITPEDEAGIQRVYIEGQGNDVSILVPPKNSSDVLALYGIEPMTIADVSKPFALIPRLSPYELMDDANGKFSATLLRQTLRKIVDEV